MIKRNSILMISGFFALVVGGRDVQAADPVLGEELEKTVAAFFELDGKVVGRLKEILK